MSLRSVELGNYQLLNSKEMSSLYFGLHVFSLLEASVPEFAVVYTSTADPATNSLDSSPK
jgi:hypothetical protein